MFNFETARPQPDRKAVQSVLPFPAAFPNHKDRTDDGLVDK
jgi:hypothetical protein